MNKEKQPLNDNCQKYYGPPKAEPRAILPVTMEKQAALEKVSCRGKSGRAGYNTEVHKRESLGKLISAELLCHELQL